MPQVRSLSEALEEARGREAAAAAEASSVQRQAELLSERCRGLQAAVEQVGAGKRSGSGSGAGKRSERLRSPATHVTGPGLFMFG